jgi:AraC-like DNA-binding protein
MSQIQYRQENQLQKIVFDSAQLLGDGLLRKEAWIDTLASAVARLDIDPAPGIDFEGRLEIVPMHDGTVSSVSATFRSARRAIRDVGIDGRDTVLFMFNAGHEMCRLSQRGRDIDCAPGEAVLYDLAEPSNAFVATPAMSRVISIQLPRSLLRQRLSNFEDRLLIRVPAQSAALSLARTYAEALLSHPGPDDPLLSRLAIGHLADLVAVAIRSPQTVSGTISPGHRAARLTAIARDIDRGFNDPNFSLTTLSHGLGVSPRQVQRLLASNQTSFVDEVMQRRLQQAHAMLTSSRHGHMSVLDISHMCGFSTVSHFHRAFRHRYGATPGELRERSR